MEMWYKNYGSKLIEFLGKSIKIGYNCFDSCTNLETVIFPNSEEVIFDFDPKENTPDDAKMLVRSNAKISSNSYIEYRISYIESSKDAAGKSVEKITESEEQDDLPNEKVQENIGGISDKLFIEENGNLKKFVSYLRLHLLKYENVISYDDFDIEAETGQSDEDERFDISSE